MRQAGAVITTVTADKNGNFAFPRIPDGHYTLRIDSDIGDSIFDVEITERIRRTEPVLIDASIVSPDCKNGHEFIIKFKD